MAKPRIDFSDRAAAGIEHLSRQMGMDAAGVVCEGLKSLAFRYRRGDISDLFSEPLAIVDLNPPVAGDAPPGPVADVPPAPEATNTPVVPPIVEQALEAAPVVETPTEAPVDPAPVAPSPPPVAPAT